MRTMVIVPSAKPEPGNSRRTRCPIHLCPVDCQAISSPSSSMMKTRAEQLWVLSVLLSLHEKIGGSPREGRAHGDKALHLPPTGAPGESKSCAIILCQSTPSVHDGDDGLPIPLRSLHSGPRSMTHQHASPQLERVHFDRRQGSVRDGLGSGGRTKWGACHSDRRLWCT